MATYRIPFNRPSFVGDELRHVTTAMASGYTAGAGPFTARCEAWLRAQVGVPQALLTTSCTHALEMCALLLDLQPGDEVILPSFTFVSTASAFVLRGARPVFGDCRPDTLNLDERQVGALITPRTRALVVMHYGGVACAMDELTALAQAHGLALVEDNAHGLLGRYRGQPLGSFGQLATQSFHETKNFSCGEGGALLINDPRLAERAEIIREKGTDRSRFFRGQVDKYTWVDLGSSYVPADLLAAMLLAQFEAADALQAARRRCWERYHAALHSWAAANGCHQPVVPPACSPAWHLYYLLLPDLASRQRLLAHLRARGILAVFHYLPLHISPMGQRLGGRPGQCPVTESVSDRLVRLPLFYSLTPAEQDDVIAAVLEFQP